MLSGAVLQTGGPVENWSRVAGGTRFSLPAVALDGVSDWSTFALRATVDTLRAKGGGPDRDRTGDLLNAIQARSQLRYRPVLLPRWGRLLSGLYSTVGTMECQATY